MTEQTLVSIIVPVYNAEKTIMSSIQSVREQTHHNWELILVDDGSTDASGRLCKEQAACDDRIRYVYQQNAGPSSARNKALQLIKGDYAAFLDSDDTLYLEAIETMLSQVREADLVIAGYENVNSNDSSSKSESVTANELSGRYSRQSFLSQYGALFEQNLIHYLWHKLYKTDIIQQLRFDETVKIGEDLLFNLAYLDQVTEVQVINEVVTKHIKDNDASLTKSYQPELFAFRKAIYTETRSFLIRHQQWRDTNKRIMNLYFSRKFYTVLYNYYPFSSPLSYSEKRELSEKMTDDVLVRELLPWIKKYSTSSKWMGIFLEKRMPLFFTLFTTLYFQYVSLKDRKR